MRSGAGSGLSSDGENSCGYAAGSPAGLVALSFAAITDTAFHIHLGREGHKTCKIAIRRIQYCPGRCLGAIAADATDANGCLLIVVNHDRELHETDIKLTNLRTLDVLETQLGHGCDQAVDGLNGCIGRCALQTSC